MAGVILDVPSKLAELEQVKTQIEAAKERDQGKISMAKFFTRMADWIMDAEHEGARTATIVDLGGISQEDLYGLVDELTLIGKAIAPEAVQTWSKEAVIESLKALEAMAFLGLIEGDDAVKAAELQEALAGLKKGGGTGQRAPRRVLPAIEGRPFVKASIVKIDDESVIATQAANKENSTSNFKTAVVKYLKAAGVEIDTELDKEIAAAVKDVVEQGADYAEIQGALRIVGIADDGTVEGDDDDDEGSDEDEA